jgi:hypothetical protein
MAEMYTVHAKNLDLAKPDLFLRFARGFPRQAFLLDRLQSYYQEIQEAVESFSVTHRGPRGNRVVFFGNSPTTLLVSFWPVTKHSNKHSLNCVRSFAQVRC